MTIDDIRMTFAIASKWRMVISASKAERRG